MSKRIKMAKELQKKIECEEIDEGTPLYIKCKILALMLVEQ
jgi:hypothetical protein